MISSRTPKPSSSSMPILVEERAPLQVQVTAVLARRDDEARRCRRGPTRAAPGPSPSCARERLGASSEGESLRETQELGALGPRPRAGLREPRPKGARLSSRWVGGSSSRSNSVDLVRRRVVERRDEPGAVGDVNAPLREALSDARLVEQRGGRTRVDLAGLSAARAAVEPRRVRVVARRAAVSDEQNEPCEVARQAHAAKHPGGEVAARVECERLAIHGSDSGAACAAPPSRARARALSSRGACPGRGCPRRACPRTSSPSASTNVKVESASVLNDLHARGEVEVTRTSRRCVGLSPVSDARTRGASSPGSCGRAVSAPSGWYSIGIPKKPAKPSVCTDGAVRLERAPKDLRPHVDAEDGLDRRGRWGAPAPKPRRQRAQHGLAPGDLHRRLEQPVVGRAVCAARRPAASCDGGLPAPRDDSSPPTRWSIHSQARRIARSSTSASSSPPSRRAVQRRYAHHDAQPF